MRTYDEFLVKEWADGEICTFGFGQTPKGFIRHSVETLYHLQRKLTPLGSIWWNIMDLYNTRTQIRGNAVEALYSMQGHDKRHGQIINTNATQQDILIYRMASNVFVLEASWETRHPMPLQNI